ncbi:MAG: hypothetical protein LBB22_01405 [Treponema sp.]|jgi:hypothetical protein|nr:hypothetical protein [Treponema sp.]
MTDSSSTSTDGSALFQTILNKTCDKLQQKNTSFALIRLSELDNILSDIEKILSIPYSVVQNTQNAPSSG